MSRGIPRPRRTFRWTDSFQRRASPAPDAGFRVVDVGRVDDDREQAAQHVDGNVPLAPFHFLPAVDAARLARGHGLDALGIDKGMGGAGLALRGRPRFGRQTTQDIVPKATDPGAAIEAVHRRIWRKIVRKIPPLAAGLHKIQNRVRQLALCPRVGSKPCVLRFVLSPLGVCQIAWIWRRAFALFTHIAKS